jgi:hypothetical protein
LIVGANFAFISWDTYAISNSCFVTLCQYYSKNGIFGQPFFVRQKVILFA